MALAGVRVSSADICRARESLSVEEVVRASGRAVALAVTVAVGEREQGDTLERTTAVSQSVCHSLSYKA